ncbi:uncharacterized protein LOC144113890 isoform X4 [Amblyomma americanum]
MSRFLKHSKVFDDSKGRFFLVLLTEASDERLSKLSLSITDGNSVWKAATSFEESCGSLKSRREENVKHLMKRISNCRLESIDDAEELTVTLVPPGKTYELKFKKSADARSALGVQAVQRNRKQASNGSCALSAAIPQQFTATSRPT